MNIYNSWLYYFFKDVRVIFFVLLDKLALINCNVQPETTTILLIRVDNIGDFILWLDSAAKLRQHYVDKKLVLIAGHTFADVAERCGYFDRVLPVNAMKLFRNPFYRWKVLRLIRKLGAQVAIQPTFSRLILVGDSLIRASGSPQRIGSTGDLSNIKPWQRRISDRWYSKILPAQTEPMMELIRNSEFLQGLGLVNTVPKVACVRILTKLPESLHITDPYFIIFPGASEILKMWPPASFATCLEVLSQRYGWRGIVCGTANERDNCQAVLNASLSHSVINLVGKTSLPEFVELVRGAKLLIGNDTSAVHIAAAVGTPSVCILGGGHFGRFIPYPDTVEGVKPVAVFREMPCYGCNWFCSQPHTTGACVPCIDCIGPKEVLQATEKALQEKKALH